MTIAAHIAISDAQNDLRKNFTYRSLLLLANRHPDDHYIFIFDKPVPEQIITEQNITPVLLKPVIKNRLLQHYFYNFKIPRLLNKYDADLFICSDVCSLRTPVPQCLIIHDLSFLQPQNLFSNNDIRYLKRYTKHFVKKARSIAVMNNHLKSCLITLFPGIDDKLTVVPMGIDATGQENHGTEFQVRSTVTDGREYFLFIATESTIPNIITMLKAFSIFKKWQKSNMQLVIMFPSDTPRQPIKDFATYKYREDVKIISGNTFNSNEVIAASYAVIHLPQIELTETEGLNALATQTALITIDSGFFRSIYNDAALYTHISDKEIAEKMMMIYKDENLRTEIIRNNPAVIAKHHWEKTADSLWQVLQQ